MKCGLNLVLDLGLDTLSLALLVTGYETCHSVFGGQLRFG